VHHTEFNSLFHPLSPVFTRYAFGHISGLAQVLTWAFCCYFGLIHRPLGTSPSCSTASECSSRAASAESRTLGALCCIISDSNFSNTAFLIHFFSHSDPSLHPQ
jgi:hypothetical protein